MAFDAGVLAKDSVAPGRIYAILFANSRPSEFDPPIQAAPTSAREQVCPMSTPLSPHTGAPRSGTPTRDSTQTDSLTAGTTSAAPRRPAALRPDDGRLARGRRSRARIREAAKSLFLERGFDGATLRAIAERAGMGASSIYRHVQSKEELLIEELSEMQEEAWTRFREVDDRNRPTAERLRGFFDVQHALLVANRDLTTIALRSTTKTEARVAKRVLQLYDRTIGLLMEILQRGRMKKDLAKDVDVLEAARVLFHVTNGARIPWANGMVSDEACLASIHQAVDLLFRGVSANAR
jgi:AcrR family transcriptional regulator